MEFILIGQAPPPPPRKKIEEDLTLPPEKEMFHHSSFRLKKEIRQGDPVPFFFMIKISPSMQQF